MMENNEFLTVGELAKQMNVTVRTLQYYDKEGLLKPSEKSQGGRRLYTKKDMVKLHQIISLKYLGFSLDEIKGKLFSLDNPKKVAEILERQSEIIKNQIENLKEALSITEALYEEVLQIETVDFSKYADIISLLKEQNENYWVIKLFDDELSSHIRERFKDNQDMGRLLYEKYSSILDKSVLLKKEGKSPKSEESIAVAKEWWDMINEFTGGDMSLIPKLMEFNGDKDNWNEEMATKQKFVDDFIGQSMEAYFIRQNIIIPEMEGDYEKQN